MKAVVILWRLSLAEDLEIFLDERIDHLLYMKVMMCVSKWVGILKALPPKRHALSRFREYAPKVTGQ